MRTANLKDRRYDAIVIGARCAGAATAMLMARQGLSVLLVDRDRRGTDTLSTLALMRAGVLQLERWGMLDGLRAAGTPAIRSTTFVYGDEAITIPIKPRDGVPALFAPRRSLLDATLADAAAAAGADVRYGQRLVDLQREPNGRVTGAVIEDRDRNRQTIAADIVIGADGRQSTVARLVNADTYRQGLHAGGVVYAFWNGMPDEGSRWFYRPGVSAGAIPTSDDQTCLFAATSARRFDTEIRHDIAAGFHRVLAECAPQLAAATDNDQRAGRYHGFAGQAGYMRQSHGDGWALVGDAGYFKDPITAHGISDALRDAQLLSDAVVRGGGEALAGYQATRDELSTELFEITDAIATFDWTLEQLQALHIDLSQAMNHEVEALLSLESTVNQTACGTIARDSQARRIS